MFRVILRISSDPFLILKRYWLACLCIGDKLHVFCEVRTEFLNTFCCTKLFLHTAVEIGFMYFIGKCRTSALGHFATMTMKRSATSNGRCTVRVGCSRSTRYSVKLHSGTTVLSLLKLSKAAFLTHRRSMFIEYRHGRWFVCRGLLHQQCNILCVSHRST
jgi:hypothetical protein